MDARQAKAILEKYRTGECSPEEEAIVEQWYAQLVETGEWQWSEGEREQLEQAMEARLLQQINAEDNRPVHRIPFLRTAHWWAAASIILVLATGAYFMLFNKTDKNNVVNLSQQQQFKNDISPAKQQVILTLSDGSTKVLDSVSNGTVTLQGTTQAVKDDSSIAYINNHSAEVVFNTITTKKGRTFHLQLADGTDVWLDALSSIHFPTSFPGAERVVEVTGQAYFEVAPSISPKGGAKQPFKVKSGNQVVEVLGTHFNINAHNQQHLQTTLLEGSVKLSSNNSAQSAFMMPGQQARLNEAGRIVVINHIDVEEVVAWKNGRFQFNSASLEEVMQQLVRWYDVRVAYEGEIPKSRFGGEISRNSNLSEVLKILKLSGVQFNIEGTMIVVKG